MQNPSVRHRCELAAVGCALLLVAGCGANHAPETRRIDNPEAAVLRAGDLPRGYREGDDTGCGLATTEGDDPELESVFANDRPRVCIIELERVWAGANGPRSVTSAAYVFHDAAAAARGFRTRTPLFAYTASLWPRETRGTGLGDEGQVVRGRGLNNPAVGVVWRTGNVLAMLVVEPADEPAALAFAHLQQRRIAGTSQAVAPPTDTIELELDDPALKLPVYWLGRSFDPAGPLPELDLGAASVLATGPGDSVKLDYGGAASGHAIGITLDVWQPDAWQRFRRTRLGRLVWDSGCARKTTVQLAGGQADIFQGYGTRLPLEPPCPSRPPDRVLAHVYLHGVVVAVDMPYCYSCAGPPVLRNPYETVAGMTAIAKGLRVRPR
jgi:hypothetical protein